MTATESKLLEVLQTLERTAGQPRMEGQPRIVDLLTEIDRLAEALPPDTPAELRHFLQRKSYQKATMFLLGRQGENQRGTCGG